MKCCQCNNQAVIKYDFGALCINCNLKYQQTVDMQIARDERHINFLMDEMEAISGVKLGGGRYPTRTPNIYTGNINFKPITLNGSVIGSINQGTINGLNVNLSNISIGNPELAQKVREFTEAVIADKTVNDEAKKETVDSLKYLSEQISNQNKNPTIIKTVVLSVAKIVEVSANLASLWAILSPFFVH